jgi:hypothetical protein
VKLSLKVLLTILFVAQTMQAESLEFVDFPLTKVDYMYREQGGPVAHLVFELWDCTVNFLQEDFASYRSDPVRFKTLKNEYHSKALPIFKKLNTFKRFIDELSYEWVEKRERAGIRELFKKMFSRNQSKTYIDKLSAQSFHAVLKDLRFFLWDTAHNAPYAQEKCCEKLNKEEKALFNQFVEVDYTEFI